MRITESQLRRIIREEILSETPFGGFTTSSGPSVTPSYKKQPGYKKYASIAHPSTRSEDEKYKGEKYTEIVKNLMSRTSDNWVIITPDDIRDRAHFGPDELEEWIRNERKSRPAGTIFAYAAGAPMSGDESSPQWAIVHDLFGHTLERFWQKHGGKRKEMIPELEIVAELHNALPDDYRISDNLGDALPDVLAAILLDVLTPGAARKIVSNQFMNAYAIDQITDAQERVDSMFRDVDTWLEKARADGFTVLTPW